MTCDIPSGVAAITNADADPCDPATGGVAVTVTVAGFGTNAGELYEPLPSTVPFAFPPVTAHVTLDSSIHSLSLRIVSEWPPVPTSYLLHPQTTLSRS